MVLKCELCGEPFDAKRSTAKYCSPRCRQQARRVAKDEPTTAAPPADPSTGEAVPRIVKLTTDEVKRLGKADSVLGEQAIELAWRIVSRKDTGSAIAAVSRELDRIMLRLAAGAATQEDQLASARRRRDEKRRQAAEAREA